MAFRPFTAAYRPINLIFALRYRRGAGLLLCHPAFIVNRAAAKRHLVSTEVVDKLINFPVGQTETLA